MMKVFRITGILALLTIVAINKPAAQNKELNFTKYAFRQGLSSVAVYDILRDSYGFLWLATEDGLNRFDGTNFKVYRHDPANPNSLKVNYITGLHESRDGTLWISTNGGGLSYYDRSKDSIFNYRAAGPIQVGEALTSLAGDLDDNLWVTGFGSIFIINPKKELLLNSYPGLLKQLNGKVTSCFLQDRSRTIWVGTNEGLYSYQPANKSIKLFRHDPDNSGSLSHNQVVKVTEDQLGNIWVATRTGLGKLVPGASGFINYSSSEGPCHLSSNGLSDLAVDANNRLWIATEEGLDVLDIATNNIASYAPDQRNPASLSSRSIRSVFIDPKGIYWIGTYRGGLNKYDENANHFNLKEFDAFDPQGLRSPIVTSFAGYQNDVFIGTDGGGLQLFNRNSRLMEHISLPITVKNNKHDLAILSLEMAKNNQLWIGTFANGLYSYSPATHAYKHYVMGEKQTDLNHNDIFCLKEDLAGNIWIGTNGGGVNVMDAAGNIVKYTQDPLKPRDPANPANNIIRAFEQDKAGRMWVCSYGSGLSVFDFGTRQFKFYNKANSGLPSDYVISIKEDSHGNMWVGTGGNGIGLLKKGASRFEQLSEKNGLANGNIQKIVEDASGKIWFSTNSGLSCFDPGTGKFKNYTHNDGLQPGGFVLGAGIRLPGGDLFFGGEQGFNYFNPAGLKTNKNIPKLVFTGLKIDNQEVGPGEDGAIEKAILLADEIHLKFKQTFSISFEALSFTVPEANQYQYQLEGFDKAWVDAGKEHKAYYANLPPGDYIFKVRASNNDGLWNNEGRNIRITVAPPFWRSMYAYILYVLLIAAILLYLRRMGIKRLQMRFEIEQERREAKQLIERERKEAEYLRKLDQVKIKFLTNLSHEFRTPISLIMGPVDNLIRQIKGDAQQNELNLVKRNAKRLLNLVNQLLDFRKMEEGEIQLQASQGELVSFVQDVCDSFNDLARRKKIHFHFYRSVEKLHVSFDHNKMERIFFNLLSNAFKFTPEGGSIAVNLSETDISNEPGFASVSVAVKDSGIGIPKEAQARVFESFFQHHTTSEILNYGTGIGLAITKEFVQTHGGSISVESEPGKGSIFMLNMKMEKAAINAEEPTIDDVNEMTVNNAGEANNSQHNQPSVLIVEDDDDFRYYIKENLKSSYRIFEAANGKDGWQKTLFNHPDVIVCDVQMPLMNGLELVQKLKSDKRTKHIPVILLTAANTPNGLLDGLETGAIDYMNKPFDFAVLQAKVHNILMLNQTFKDTYSRQVTVSLPETEVVSAKDVFLQKLVSYLYENLNSPELSVEQLSTHMFMSRASLYNRVLEYTGMTPVEFIRSVKLEKAKELLLKSDMTITEIAYELGFANPNYFAKVFRGKYNMTPSEFQARQAKENPAS